MKRLTESRSTSFWLKDAIQSATKRDPVDALRDAETLVSILQKRLGDVRQSEGTGPRYDYASQCWRDGDTGAAITL